MDVGEIGGRPGAIERFEHRGRAFVKAGLRNLLFANFANIDVDHYLN